MPVIFLALLIAILPYPVDAIILPIIVPFFLFAFFNLIHLYLSKNLEEMIKHYYSKIIVLVEFGVWYNFFQAIGQYINPFREIFDSLISPSLSALFEPLISNLYTYNIKISGYLLSRFLFDISILCLSILFALVAGKQVVKYIYFKMQSKNERLKEPNKIKIPKKKINKRNMTL